MKHLKKIYIAVALMAVLSIGFFSTLTMAGSEAQINFVPVHPEVTVGVPELIRATYTKGNVPDGMEMTVITPGAGTITDVQQKGNQITGIWTPEMPDGFFHAYITVSAADGTTATIVKIINPAS